MTYIKNATLGMLNLFQQSFKVINFNAFKNQRTNGPVNAHLISGPSKSTKQTKPGNKYEKDLIIKS